MKNMEKQPKDTNKFKKIDLEFKVIAKNKRTPQ